jgi:RNA 3'-terminal phosphate cyclase (ATP)
MFANRRTSFPSSYFPGLQPQHLTGISLVSEMYQGSLTGAEVKSAEVTFSPGGFRAGKYVADTKTAGSLCLLIQVSLPCLVFGSLDGQETHVKLCGGTNASNAPQIDYFQRVFGPIVTRFGIGYELELVKRGFYPQGRGLAHLRCRSLKAGQTLTPLVMESQGQLKEILITAFTAGIVPHHEAQDASRTAQEILADHYPGVPIRIELTQETRDSAYGNGAAITVTATTSTDCILAGSALGEKGKDGFAMGTEAANQLIQNIDQGGALDEFAQDQVIIFMALANGHSKVRVGPIQLHTETSIHFATYMTGASFTVTPVDPQDFERPDTEQSFWIECDGIAYNSTPAASSSKRK